MCAAGLLWGQLPAVLEATINVHPILDKYQGRNWSEIGQLLCAHGKAIV
jgi:hypothetical protein